jgi:hypothetical protein
LVEENGQSRRRRLLGTLSCAALMSVADCATKPADRPQRPHDVDESLVLAKRPSGVARLPFPASCTSWSRPMDLSSVLLSMLDGGGHRDLTTSGAHKFAERSTAPFPTICRAPPGNHSGWHRRTRILARNGKSADRGRDQWRSAVGFPCVADFTELSSLAPEGTVGFTTALRRDEDWHLTLAPREARSYAHGKCSARSAGAGGRES